MGNKKLKTEQNNLEKPISIFDNSELIINRLRELNEPIQLFDESQFNRVKRLKLAELNLHEKKTSSKGTKNVYRDIQEKIEAEIENEATSTKQTKKFVPTFINNKPTTNRKDFNFPEDFILAFFKQILSEWQNDLDKRPLETRRTAEGKKSTATLLQTYEYFAPFFSQLEAKKCSADILRQVESIALLMQRKEYLRATNEYLTMSIGNAPWPIGLTMVSIHERKGRSKIYTSQIAHILNDEETRKYIQSIKRLITFCQKKYPPDSSNKSKRPNSIKEKISHHSIDI